MPVDTVPSQVSQRPHDHGAIRTPELDWSVRGGEPQGCVADRSRDSRRRARCLPAPARPAYLHNARSFRARPVAAVAGASASYVAAPGPFQCPPSAPDGVIAQQARRLHSVPWTPRLGCAGCFARATRPVLRPFRWLPPGNRVVTARADSRRRPGPEGVTSALPACPPSSGRSSPCEAGEHVGGAYQRKNAGRGPYGRSRAGARGCR